MQFRAGDLFLRSRARLAGGALVAVSSALLIGACAGYEKSSNPLSPTVAGPIPRVNISQPNTVQPGQNARISSDQQPITLTIDNANTSGPRPLSYRFDVATDGGFGNLVFTREGVAPGDGRTSLRLPDALGSGRTYFWRARAQDGANTGPYSGIGSFFVFTPVVLSAPVAAVPANVTTSNTHPVFVIGNVARGGPVGPILYTIEISSSASFSPLVAIWQIGEQVPQTVLNSPADLPAGTTLFWHVRGSDPSVTGPFSAPQTFKTPAAVVAPPPSGGGGAPCLTNTPEGIVTCERSKYGATVSSTDIVNMLRAIAHDLNAQHYPGGPWGILEKTSGSSCNGFSCDIICAGQGGGQTQYDVFIDAGGSTQPTWNGPLSPITPRTCDIIP